LKNRVSDMPEFYKNLRTRIVQSVYDIASIMSTAVITIMIVFTFVFRIAGVVGPSMMATLNDGDKLIVSAFLNKPKAGDIVIITQPNFFHEPLVKRIVAMEGQEVYIDFDKGYVYVDGIKKNEPYVKGSTTDKFDIDFPITVPEGCVFVMGDNRNHSTDSRSSQVGFVDEDYLLGKVIGRIVPTGTWQVDRFSVN
jgi:signal peptidase I